MSNEYDVYIINIRKCWLTNFAVDVLIDAHMIFNVTYKSLMQIITGEVITIITNCETYCYGYIFTRMAYKKLFVKDSMLKRKKMLFLFIALPWLSYIVLKRDRGIVVWALLCHSCGFSCPGPWGSYTKLAVRASSTHVLIAQSVRASEQNSVVVSSNPTQVNLL